MKSSSPPSPPRTTFTDCDANFDKSHVGTIEASANGFSRQFAGCTLGGNPDRSPLNGKLFGGRAVMKDGAAETLRSSVPQVGSFVNVRGKTWIVEGAEKRGSVQALSLISCEDDSQGEALELAYAAELQTEILDPNDWSPLLTKTFEGPQRLGAYLRSTQWRTATAADRKLFQAPFRAGMKIDAYQMEPLRKALRMPRVNLFIADDTGLGKTIEAGLIARELLLRKKAKTVVVATSGWPRI